MKQNGPVTGREFDYSEHDMLVSATDLSSHIQYCNPAFVAVSGFERDELIGQPHNLIRHPDMPEAAFQDMWHTIKSGKSWSAMVKNRRRDGDHYWVRANVTPIVEGGRAVGYLSVRTKPGRAEVAQAEALYADMRAGRASVRIQGGQLVRTGLRGVLQMTLRRLSNYRATVAALTCGVLAIGGVVAFDAPLSSPGIVAGAALLAANAVLAWSIERSRTKHIGSVGALAGRLAAGDLAASDIANRPNELAEITRSLAQLKVSLIAIVSDVRQQIDGVQRASTKISGGNTDLSARTEDQAAALEQTAASLEQLTVTVSNNAAAANRASALLVEVKDATSAGVDAVGLTEGAMNEIVESSAQITSIVSAIDGIAFQTNVLALNAAVEAARAGEAGKGFAVVASEVRSLAQRCAASAREVKRIVDTTVETSRRGSGLVAGAASQMSRIEQALGRVAAVMDEVAVASGEQAKGIAGINGAVVQLDGATQQNAALVQQNAHTAEQLSGQAGGLDEAVRLFSLPARSVKLHAVR